MRNLCFLVAFVLSFTICGQSYVVFGSRLDGVHDNFSGTALQSERRLVTDTPPIFSGSFYFYDSFKKGKIMDSKVGANPVECYLIYNVFRDIMIMSFSIDGEDSAPLKREQHISVSLDGRNFKHLQYTLDGKSRNTYVEVLEEFTNNYILGVVHTKTTDFREVAGNSSYASRPPILVRTDYEFVLIGPDGNAKRLKNNEESLISGFDNLYQSKMRDYIEANNIRFEDDYKGLIAVARHYASIKSEKSY